MDERQQRTADGETEDQLNDPISGSEPPVDESDQGPAPVIRGHIDNDAEPRNTNEEPHPTIDAEDAKSA